MRSPAPVPSQELAVRVPWHRVRTRLGKVRSRPLVSGLDLFYLAYLGPLRLMAAVLPPRAFLAVTRPLTAAYRATQGRRIETLRRVMEKALPECDSSVVRSYAVKNVEGFAERALEDLVRRRLIHSPDQASVEGEDLLRQALAEGRGLILFSGHFYGSRAGRVHLERYLGLRLRAVRRGLPPPRNVGRFGRRFLQPSYDRLLSHWLGDEILLRDRRDAPLQLLRALRENGIVNTQLDAIDSRDVWKVRFFHDDRLFPGGLLDLVRVTGAPLAQVDFLSDGAGQVRVRFHERTRLEHVEDRDEFIARNLPRLVAQLEATIRADPDQWEGWGEFDRMIAPRELGSERSTDA
ncbi:MAG: hypothetical protein VYE73_15895 [Acidobacteriota bacterium]|nr:hypothetical protein [Acidobacteriota bacterium]